MIVSLIITLLLGVIAAFMVYGISKSIGRPAPSWTLPAIAGAAMLGFHIWSGYSWFSRTTGQLPPHIAIAKTYSVAPFYEPWSLLFPRIERFSALDKSSIKRNPELPDLVIAEVIFVGRYVPTGKAMQIYDCAKPRRADFTNSLLFAPNGEPKNAQWIDIEADDPLRKIACAKEVEPKAG